MVLTPSHTKSIELLNAHCTNGFRALLVHHHECRLSSIRAPGLVNPRCTEAKVRVLRSVRSVTEHRI